MKTLKLFYLLFIAALFVSCGHKKEAREVTENFFRAIKNDKTEDMQKYYPKVSELENYYKSDTIIIKDVTIVEDKAKDEKSDKKEEKKKGKEEEEKVERYAVQLTNKYTNGFGKATETDITIFVEPKNNKDLSEGFIIYDSKGLCDYSDDEICKYGKRKKTLKIEDSTTDQEIAAQRGTIAIQMLADVYKFKTYLIENVKVANWNWETSDYSYSASGRGVVKNNTPYSIPNLKYIVTYKLSNGTEVTQDDGYVSYSNIRPYGSESFSFYTSYVGNASKANIRLEFDEDFIYEIIAKGDF